MKLLLDECTPKRLKRDFPGHQAFTVDDVGLKGLKNGALLRAAAGQFDVLITVDRKLPFQQNLADSRLALLILIAKPNRYPELKLLVPKTLQGKAFPPCAAAEPQGRYLLLTAHCSLYLRLRCTI